MEIDSSPKRPKIGSIATSFIEEDDKAKDNKMDATTKLLTNGWGELKTPTPNVQRELDRARTERDTFYMKYDIDKILHKLLAGTMHGFHAESDADY